MEELERRALTWGAVFIRGKTVALYLLILASEIHRAAGALLLLAAQGSGALLRGRIR